MKKLLLTAAIAMSIVVANGAACTWGVTGAATASIKNGSTTWSSAGSNPVAYLFLASDTAAVEAAKIAANGVSGVVTTHILTSVEPDTEYMLNINAFDKN